MHSKINTKNVHLKAFKNIYKDCVLSLQEHQRNIILKKLIGKQIPHVLHICQRLAMGYQCALDASDTGTGKTPCACAAAKLSNRKPFIICPATVVTTWKEWLETFNIDYYGIVNIEKIRSKKNRSYYQPYKYYDRISGKTKTQLIQVPCPDFGTLPRDVLIIIDEAHNYKNTNTLNYQTVEQFFTLGHKILLLSATLADKIEFFKPFAHMLGLIANKGDFRAWLARAITKVPLNEIEIDSELSGKKINGVLEFKAINRELFPKCGSRLRTTDLADYFPDNNVISQCYKLEGEEGKVNALYERMQYALKMLKDPSSRAPMLAEITRIRKELEYIKLPIAIQLIKDILEENEGNQIPVFVNYKETLDYLRQEFPDAPVIVGGQKRAERDEAIRRFQSGESRLLFSTIDAGGTGISLHDKLGNRPRKSIIFPTFSGIKFIQVLGRICRTGAKTKCTQLIIWIEGTYEEDINEKMREKVKCISSLNNGDENYTNITDRSDSFNLTGLIGADDGYTEDDLECPICLSQIEVSKMNVLHESLGDESSKKHTCCDSCVRKMFGTGTEIRCPLCREHVKITQLSKLGKVKVYTTFT